MSRPTVPHCKSCSCLKSHVRSGSSSLTLSSWYFCTHLQFGAFNRSISGQEVRTCPKWCPKRCSHRRYQRMGVIT